MSPTGTFLNFLSRATVWLLSLFCAVFPSLANSSPDSLHYLETIHLPVKGSARVVAATTTAGGELMVLVTSPARILEWDPQRGFIGEFPVSDERRANPVEIASDGGFGLLAVDPFRPFIYRLTRRGEIVAPLSLIAEEDVEPVTLYADPMGKVFFLSQRDGDLWVLGRDGRSLPLMTSLRGVPRAFARMEYDILGERLLLLQNDTIRAFSQSGVDLWVVNSGIAKSVGMTVAAGSIWIVGEGIASLPLTNGANPFSLPVDSLSAWGVAPAADIAAFGRRLYIVGRSGAVAIAEIRQRSVSVGK